MNFPKPTEENIELTNEDLKETEDMKRLTFSIENLIKEQENEVTNFYRHFQSFETWLTQNSSETEKLKELIIEKTKKLREHAENTIEVLNKIKQLILDEEKIESKKIMIKLDISKDFDQEQMFAKKLRYPHGVVKLAQEITQEIEHEKEEANQDLKIEHKTEELVDNMLLMMSKIKKRLEEFEQHMYGNDLSQVNNWIHAMTEDIMREHAAFQKLSQFEKLHLHLLMSLYGEEQSTLKRESEFSEEQKKFVK